MGLPSLPVFTSVVAVAAAAIGLATIGRIQAAFSCCMTSVCPWMIDARTDVATLRLILVILAVVAVAVAVVAVAVVAVVVVMRR
jgi:hypothetical protein